VDEDCTFTQFEFLVTNIDECFCPMCPSWPVTLSEHSARSAAWQNICADWSLQEPCPMPGCLDPGDTLCVEQICVDADLAGGSCSDNILCAALPPECPEGLTPVELNGCWGCGYPETCTCDDGQLVECKMLPPTCTEGTILAEQSACYACVDPMTCAPPK